MSGRSFLEMQVRRAQALGHDLQLRERHAASSSSTNSWEVTCSCGMRTTRRSRTLALGAGMKHVGKVTGDGVSLPPAVGGGL